MEYEVAPAMAVALMSTCALVWSSFALVMSRRALARVISAAPKAEPITVNVYPGGLVTRADVARNIAAREGSRVPASMLRGRGQS
jgi:hypothetical protein